MNTQYDFIVSGSGDVLEWKDDYLLPYTETEEINMGFLGPEKYQPTLDNIYAGLGISSHLLKEIFPPVPVEDDMVALDNNRKSIEEYLKRVKGANDAK